jgi:lipopolysaccharide transport system permease protein
VVVNLVRFAIQFVIFFGLLLFIDPHLAIDQPLRWFVALIVSVVIIAALGLGLGLVFSILTAKYRDLVNVIHLIARLLMFATPIIYPISVVNPEFQFWVYLNPLSSMVELYRFGFLGQGTFTGLQLGYSVVCALVLVAFGVMLFNKFGNKLQDVI